LPVVLEAGGDVGGISRTIVHNGNRMDIGGHRFFSKSAWVMNWWREILPADPDAEAALLVRRRLSRIYYRKRFFDYPVRLSARTLRALGLTQVARIGASYLRARLFPRKPESSLEDFLINRFGRALYRTFFKDYTEKVWGIPCRRISAEWGAQRIKGLSITGAIAHALRSLTGRRGATRTSLIERFLYPRLGPGQLWQRVAERVRAHGGTVLLHRKVVGIEMRDGRAAAVLVRDERHGGTQRLEADWVISTMPVCDLVRAMDPPPPPAVAEVAAALPYRDFITVGLLLDGMKGGLPPDNWIYVQEPDVQLGRLQVFNNWSPGLVADPSKAWLGLEYFCCEGDALWSLSDADMVALAAEELVKIGLVETADVRDAKVVRVPKAYPAYFGGYRDFAVVRRWLDDVPNLFLVGRNGMHRYNNQDHSMLTAKLAVDAIAAGCTDKAAIWAVNIDDEYHEEATPSQAGTAKPAVVCGWRSRASA
jgi:protoporphyrinogen oxidase